MCDKNSKIQLCTCSNINKKEFFMHDNLDYPFLVKWTLHRFVKNEWVGMDGMLMEPIGQFNAEFTADFFCNEMNTCHCFDFEYYPIEGDTIAFKRLTFTKSGKKIKKNCQQNHRYISLMYRDKQWVIDAYDSFYNTTKEIKEGFLKLNK